VLSLLTLAPVWLGFAQQQPDPALLAEIQKIKAVDNHAHVPRVDLAGEADDEYDALPCGNYVEPTADNVMVRPDNPEYLAAWKALWGYRYNDAAPAHVKELLATKQRTRKDQGEHYPEWVLDRLGIEVMFANRIAMGRGLNPPHFRWVPYDDALMYPLDNSLLAENPDRKFFFSREDKLLRRYLNDLGLGASPSTLDEYLKQVVTPTLERQKARGAVAVKFEAAYLRSLDFAPAAEIEARAVYGEYFGSGTPENARYKTLQDFLFHYITLRPFSLASLTSMRIFRSKRGFTAYARWRAMSATGWNGIRRRCCLALTFIPTPAGPRLAGRKSAGRRPMSAVAP
jgi:hypothetical protein